MTDTALTCANHPARATSLRCNRCGKPICAGCAVLTPVGYRCKECVRGQQAVFDTAGGGSLLIGAAVSFVGAGLAIALLSFLEFWGLLVAPIAGGGLAEIVRWIVRRKRNRRLPLSAAIGAGVGVAIYLMIRSLPWLAYLITGEPGFVSGSVFALLWPLGYGALLISALYSRLRGIRLGG